MVGDWVVGGELWGGYVALQRERAVMEALGLAEMVVLSSIVFRHGGFSCRPELM